jgi:O-antigen/teichoic acid export membrane protein
VVGIATIYYFFPGRLSAPTAMGANVVSGAVALCVGIFFLRQILPPEINMAKAEYTLRPWLNAAFPMLVYGGAQIVLGQTDIVMLGAIRGAAEVGLYAAANRLVYLLMYVTVSVEVIMAPIISRLYTIQEKDRLQRIVTKSVRLAFFAVFPFGLILIFAGDYVLVIFGRGFIAATAALTILTTGRLVGIALGSGGLLLGMTGHERTVAMVLTAICLSNILLNALLIPQFGIEGAAFSTAISLFMAQLLLSIYAAKRSRLSVTILGRWPCVS